MKRLLRTIIALISLTLIGLLGIIGAIAYISSELPQINSLKDYRPPMNSKILSRDGEILLEIGKETRDVVEFKNIPQRIVQAFLAAEDDNFYHHAGIDYLGIIRAFIVNLKEGRLVQGGSTITQQVAKSLLLSRERTISRKIKDLLLARKIEKTFTKEEILFLYLNQVYLGGGYYGVKAAFNGYFEKPLEKATIAEAALVAGLLVAPGRYSPYVNPMAAKKRQQYVLKRLFDTQKISKEEFEKAMSESIRLKLREPTAQKGGHFTDWIRQELMKSVGTDVFLQEGFQVVTTLDWSLQKMAEQIVKSKVKELDKRQGFRGPVETISEDEISLRAQEERESFFREASHYFTFLPDGKIKYERSEEEGSFQELIKYYQEQEETIPTRWRGLVELGNKNTDELPKNLKIDEMYVGTVIRVDDLKRLIFVNYAGTKIVIPESGFSWAHERKFSEDPIYFASIQLPSKILKRGDRVGFRVKEASINLVKVIHNDFFKKYTDPNLKKYLSKQDFILAELDQEPEAEGALVSIQPGTGDIISLVGGVDFQRSQFNRVLQSSRQPGSSFKPFIYAVALENGYQSNTILYDTPQALGGVDESLNWKPKNYDGEFKGPMTFRQALEISRNIPTIKLVQDLGVKKIHDFSSRIGINAKLPNDMSLSLGSFGVSLAELVRIYGIFPNGGRKTHLKAIISIKDRNGKNYSLPNLFPENNSSKEKKDEDQNPEDVSANLNPFQISLNSEQVYDPRLAYIMTSLMKGVVTHGTATEAAKLGLPLAGKTGTTNNYVDALFVGFSSGLVTGTWVGFDDNRTLGYGETGGKTALPMWVEYMSNAVRKYGAHEFAIPEGIVQNLVYRDTGRSAQAAGPGVILESFVDGNVLRPVTGQEHGGETSPTNGTSQPSTNIEDDDFFMNQ